MNTNWTAMGIVSACGLALVPLFAAVQAEGPKVQVGKVTGKALTAASELKWIPLQGIEGALQAQIEGDASKEAHRAFFKYPVGLKAPLHSHSSGDRAVIVSGALSIALDGAPAKKLGPGSYFSIAAGIPHTTAVDGDQPCVFYIEREGAFDVVLKDAAGGKKN